jgi:hypothetical protein
VIPGGERIAESVRGATGDAAKAAIEGFAGAAVLAVGDAAVQCIRERASMGTEELARTIAGAYATDVIGHLVTQADAEGLAIGDVRVSTRLADFASGKPLRSPIGAVSVQHAFPFVIGGCGALEASGKLTLHASCEPDDAHALKTSAWGKIELSLAWSSEEKKAAP